MASCRSDISPYRFKNVLLQTSAETIGDTHLGNLFFVDSALFINFCREIDLICSLTGINRIRAMILLLPVCADFLIVPFVFCPAHPYRNLGFLRTDGKFYFSLLLCLLYRAAV